MDSADVLIMIFKELIPIYKFRLTLVCKFWNEIFYYMFENWASRIGNVIRPFKLFSGHELCIYKEHLYMVLNDPEIVELGHIRCIDILDKPEKLDQRNSRAETVLRLRVCCSYGHAIIKMWCITSCCKDWKMNICGIGGKIVPYFRLSIMAYIDVYNYISDTILSNQINADKYIEISKFKFSSTYHNERSELIKLKDKYIKDIERLKTKIFGNGEHDYSNREYKMCKKVIRANFCELIDKNNDELELLNKRKVRDIIVEISLSVSNYNIYDLMQVIDVGLDSITDEDVRYLPSLKYVRMYESKFVGIKGVVAKIFDALVIICNKIGDFSLLDTFERQLCRSYEFYTCDYWIKIHYTILEMPIVVDFRVINMISEYNQLNRCYMNYDDDELTTINYNETMSSQCNLDTNLVIMSSNIIADEDPI